MPEKIYLNYNLNKNNWIQLNKNIKLGFIISFNKYKIFLWPTPASIQKFNICRNIGTEFHSEI